MKNKVYIRSFYKKCPIFLDYTSIVDTLSNNIEPKFLFKSKPVIHLTS